ncbi:MAG TPA: serine hydrolase domain-containing protein [Candidatus Eremiobacteraceae bacterium]|nr:serine hydrolase domain-containing protein [Candidatus Eremiobacteraceae bacterium]
MGMSLLAVSFSIVLAAVSPLVGAWESSLTFGHNIAPGTVRLVTGSRRVATIGGHVAYAPLSFDEPKTVFEFDDGSKLVFSSNSATGEWIQPATTTYGESFTTPVVLTKRSESESSGSVRPIADTTHFYLTVTQDADGSLTTFLRNPEVNAGARIGVRTLAVNGDSLRFRADGKPDIIGAYDSSAKTLQLSLAGYPTPFTFKKVDAGATPGFAPRAGSSTFVYQEPVQKNDGWQTASLTDVGLDPAKVAAFVDSILASPATSPSAPYITSVSIARHGKLVLDEYFYGYDASTVHDVRSAGKSITTLMVGDAMEDDSNIKTTTRLYDLLPQYDDALSSDPRKKNITVADLMTMSSGLACDDNDDSSPGNEGTMQSQTAVPDWYRYTLALPVVADPGSKAVYCSAGINVLGAVIATANRGSLADYFYDRFAGPMQFGPYALPMMPPPLNAAYMAGGGQFLPRDFLKFGQLILNGGTWNGRRIVDSQFIAAATSPHSGLNSPDDYGYGWHLSTFDVGGVSYPAINAGGNGGQLLFVIPKLDMAVMITADNYGQYGVWRHFQTDPFENYLIPAALATH